MIEPIGRIVARTAVLPSTDIDTDQIIPARFLRTTTRLGLGKQLFADWRYAADGSERADFLLNQPQSKGCTVLVSGRNFGCGSSREHAPWALLDYGFRVVISSEIADIFRSNALKNGLLPLEVDATTHGWLLDNPGATVTVDLESTTLSLPDGRQIRFSIEPFARYCLLNGVDQLGYLVSQDAQIAAYEKAHAAT